jgi:hypothetical protein
MTLLADLLIDTGRFDEALPLAIDAKANCAKAFGNEHWRTASAASAEGAALAGLEKYAEAEDLLVDSVRILQNDAGALPFFVANAKRWLAELYLAMGRSEEAAKYR